MRPHTGPYRQGEFRPTEYRKCDDCHVPVIRKAGRYMPTSRTHQVWCCDKCATRREGQALEVAA